MRTLTAGREGQRRSGAAEIIDPRGLATGTIRDIYEKYQIGHVLPAMDYSQEQLHELEPTTPER